jgi:hypothetical protein
MQRIAFLLFPLLLISCGEQKTPKSQEVEPKIKVDKSFQTIKHGTIGIILTNELTVYDLHKNVLKKVGNLYGEIVEIDSISKNKFDLKNTDDRCNLYNFVKVRGKKINGWVYGPEVYEQQRPEHALINKAADDTILNFSGVQIKIIPTKNFNIGVYDELENMLSFCDGNHSPVILYNSIYNKYESIPLENKTSGEINYPSKYFVFDSHDGWHDKLISSRLKGNVLTLEMKRELQEGHAKYMIEITLDRNQSRGKIISYVHDPYSYG